VNAEISSITAKGTPVDGDFLLIEDSAASDAKKRITIGDLPSSGGGGELPVAFVAGTVTVTAAGIWIIDSDAAIRTVTLPLISATGADGMRVIIKRDGTNFVDIDTAGSDDFEPGGISTQRLFLNWSALSLVANTAGNYWYELGYYGAIT
jgi:hypothetical protein